jgi:hypothetical protein
VSFIVIDYGVTIIKSTDRIRDVGLWLEAVTDREQEDPRAPQKEMGYLPRS